MNVWIQSDIFSVPKTLTLRSAEEGFKNLGHRIFHFSNIDELEYDNTKRDEIVVGGIGYIEKMMKKFGVEIPSIDYPDALQKFYGRKIWKDTLDNALRSTENIPFFIKPIREKRFNGFVYDGKHLPDLKYAEKDEPCYCSEVIDFVSEYRVFVRYGKIIDVRHYKGEWNFVYSPAWIESAVIEYMNSKTDPAFYAMDIGITNHNESFIVEINDGYSIGDYGLDSIEYAKCLSARWSELVGIHDECDLVGEKNEWLKRRQ